MQDNINQEIIKSENDILTMLDSLLEKRDNEWWNNFYANKEKPIPFFVNKPDENLISYIDKRCLNKGKALDIGCGNGRNSIYLSQQGFNVTGVDFSEKSIEWAKKMAEENLANVNFLCESIFNYKEGINSFDFIYDSGCLHHIKPHRRNQYLKIVSEHLKPEGCFGLVCFNLKGGANISDFDVYRGNSMAGGLGFSEFKLKTILKQYFEIIEFREMTDSKNNNEYGLSTLWTVLMKRK